MLSSAIRHFLPGPGLWNSKKKLQSMSQGANMLASLSL